MHTPTALGSAGLVWSHTPVPQSALVQQRAAHPDTVSVLSV
jgi:hypothetical protein